MCVTHCPEVLGGEPSEGRGWVAGGRPFLWGCGDRATRPFGPEALEAGLGAGSNLWAGPEEGLVQGRRPGQGQGRAGAGPGAGPGPAREMRGSRQEFGPRLVPSSQAWLRAVGAGGPGRLGLGLGCLLPGASRVGAEPL